MQILVSSATVNIIFIMMQKSETANTTINTLIGVNGSGTLSCRYFFGYENKNAGIEFYINGEQTEARNFKMSDSWARYGMIIDTSNEALLSAINSYSTEFWDSDIHFSVRCEQRNGLF